MKVLALALFIILSDPCRPCQEAPIEGVKEIGCRIKQESHGWKLWLQLIYQSGHKWEHLEKPPGREFWPSDGSAFGRCSEWRNCISKRILELQKEARRK